MRKISNEFHPDELSIIIFLDVFEDVASKLEKVGSIFSSFNPFPSLPSVATDDRKQFQYSERVLNCWFASDVTTAMLVVKINSISLRWEMNSILMQIYQKSLFCIDHQHGRLVTWLQTKNNKTKALFLEFN